MTTTEEAREGLERLLERSMDAERRDIIDLLAPMHAAREARLEAEKEEKRYQPRVKQWLELHEEDESLSDPEHGVPAYYLAPAKTTTWDLRPLSDAEVLALHKAGLLTMATKAFDAIRQAAPSTTWDGIQHRPGVRVEGATYSLRVRE